jgi:hypothetical protein
MKFLGTTSVIGQVRPISQDRPSEILSSKWIFSLKLAGYLQFVVNIAEFFFEMSDLPVEQGFTVPQFEGGGHLGMDIFPLKFEVAKTLVVTQSFCIGMT